MLDPTRCGLSCAFTPASAVRAVQGCAADRATASLRSAESLKTNVPSERLKVKPIHRLASDSFSCSLRGRMARTGARPVLSCPFSWWIAAEECPLPTSPGTASSSPTGSLPLPPSPSPPPLFLLILFLRGEYEAGDSNSKTHKWPDQPTAVTYSGIVFKTCFPTCAYLHLCFSNSHSNK